jgi:hypothetical protein
MKKLQKILVLIVVLFSLWSIDNCLLTTAHAAVPHLVNYQGRLTDSSGTPLNGSYNITFRIYDAATAGNLLWQEAQIGVVIQKGIFSVLLGSVTALNLAFDKQYFLAVQVGSDPEMNPRQMITSAGYAVRAETAEQVPGLDPGMVGTKKVDETGLADGMIPYYDNASGKVKYKAIPTTSLGSWDATKTVNTVYQAATDGFVLVMVDINSNYGDLTVDGITNSSNPPTTVRQEIVQPGYTRGQYGSDSMKSFCMPVKKSDYWKIYVLNSYGLPITIFWIPLGG